VAKIINISEKLNNEKPIIQVGEKSYIVNDGIDVVFRFEELTVAGTKGAMMEAIRLTLGEDAVEELGAGSWSIKNFKVLTIAILAAMQDLDYEEAEARFQKSQQGQ
jgi:hypothetical protein